MRIRAWAGDETVASMTTPIDLTQAHTRVVVAALACSAVLAMSAPSASAAPGSAETEASPVRWSSHHRQDLEAHRIVHHDARRDVLNFDAESEARSPAPHNRTSDIVTTVVDHQSNRLVVEARVRHLSRMGYHLMVSQIVTSDGRRYELEVEYSLKPIGSSFSLRRSSGKDVSCPGGTWSINRSIDRISASVPNSCLGDPAWIRVGVALVEAPLDFKASWVDDSRRQGRIGERHPTLGPRQHREVTTGAD